MTYLCVRGIDLVSFCDFAVGYRISVVFLVFHFIQTLCIFCKEFMFYLCYLYLFTYTGVQHDFHIRWSFNSNTTGATCGAGTANPPGVSEFTSVLVGICCSMFCLPRF